MATRGRDYAENLVGALDRGSYQKQRDAIRKTYNTNWQNIQNQYKNLTEKIKRQQKWMILKRIKKIYIKQHMIK